MRNAIAGELKPGENPSLFTKIMAAMATGAIAIAVANPTDVVKVRLQSQHRLMDPSKMYKGTIDCYRRSYADAGIRGFWVGLVPNVLRNSVVNAAEMASYDQYKQMFL